MRPLTNNEQLIVKKLVQLKTEAKLEELQVAKLLRKELECFALRWSLEPKNTLFFYSHQNSSMPSTDWDSLKNSYFQVADFLYFIEELEQENLIRIQTLPYKIETDNERILYDRDKFQYKPNSDTFWRNSDGISYLVPIDAEHKVFIDFVNYLEKYANKVIYPLPLLSVFLSNGFKSIEQKNFEQELSENNQHHNMQMEANKEWQKKQLTKTNQSLLIATIALIISAIMPLLANRCTPPTELNNAQLKTIEQAIINSKSQWPNIVNIQSSDTLNYIIPSKMK